MKTLKTNLNWKWGRTFLFPLIGIKEVGKNGEIQVGDSVLEGFKKLVPDFVEETPVEKPKEEEVRETLNQLDLADLREIAEEKLSEKIDEWEGIEDKGKMIDFLVKEVKWK
jgi:hypothetical protein